MTRLGALARSAAGVVFMGRALAQGGLFVVAVAPALMLDHATFNRFTAALTVVALAVIAPAGAFQQHLARRGVASHPYRALRDNSAVVAVLAVVGLAVSGWLVGWSSWLGWVALGGVGLATASWWATSQAVAGRFVRAAVIDAGSGVMMAVAAAVAWAVSGGVDAWSLAFLAGGAAGVALGVVLSERTAAPVTPVPGLVPLVTSALPLFAIGFLAMAYNRLDLLILQRLAPDAETASYAIAGRLVGPLLIGLGSLNNSLYPKLLVARSTPERLLPLARRYSVRLGLACLAVAPLLAVGVALASPAVDALDDLDLAWVVLLLGLAVVPYAFAIPYGFLLTAVDRESRWMAGLAAALVLDIVLVATIAHRSAFAAAVAWLVVQVVLAVVILATVRERFVIRHAQARG